MSEERQMRRRLSSPPDTRSDPSSENSVAEINHLWAFKVILQCGFVNGFEEKLLMGSSPSSELPKVKE